MLLVRHKLLPWLCKTSQQQLISDQLGLLLYDVLYINFTEVWYQFVTCYHFVTEENEKGGLFSKRKQLQQHLEYL